MDVVLEDASSTGSLHRTTSLAHCSTWCRGEEASSLSLGSSQLVNTPAQHTGGEQHSWQAHSISISISASADKSERQTRESWTRDSETWRGNSADREITWRLLDLQIDSCSKISFLIVILLDRKLRGGGRYRTRWNYLNLEENIWKMWMVHPLKNAAEVAGRGSSSTGHRWD